MRALFALAPVVLVAVALSGCPSQAAGRADCTPGETITVGCTSSVGRRCSGDPTLTVCDGSVAPNSCRRGSGDIAFNDDSDGLCPQVTLVCPASGSISVNPDPFSSSSTSWTCAWAVSHGGVGP